MGGEILFGPCSRAACISCSLHRRRTVLGTPCRRLGRTSRGRATSKHHPRCPDAPSLCRRTLKRLQRTNGERMPHARRFVSEAESTRAPERYIQIWLKGDHLDRSPLSLSLSLSSILHLQLIWSRLALPAHSHRSSQRRCSKDRRPPLPGQPHCPGPETGNLRQEKPARETQTIESEASSSPFEASPITTNKRLLPLDISGGRRHRAGPCYVAARPSSSFLPLRQVPAIV